MTGRARRRGGKAECPAIPGAPVWQRSYYEHIVREAGDLQRIRRYIRHNPEAWCRQ